MAKEFKTDLDVSGNIAVSGNVDGRNVSSDGAKLDNIESGATADQSDEEIETGYNNQVSIVSQAEAEAGTATTSRRWTAQRVKQAIEALGGVTFNNSFATVASGDVDCDFDGADGGMDEINLTTTGTSFTLDMTGGKAGAIYSLRIFNYSTSTSVTLGSNVFTHSLGTSISIKTNSIYTVHFDGTNYYLK